MSTHFSKKAISEDDLLDLHGKVAIVTGGNTGIGYGTVQFLVRKGAKVYIAGRSEDRIAASVKRLESEGIEDGTLHVLKVDLANPRSAKQAANDFLMKESRLDILVNNAAMYLVSVDVLHQLLLTSDPPSGATGPYYLTNDGLLDIIATNHVGHFVLTEGLLPLLKSTAQEKDSDVRIVNVTSVAHDRVKPESFVGKENLNKSYGHSFNGYIDTYGLSKLANILHVKELQRRLNVLNIPIVCTAVHPGPVATVGANHFLRSVPYLGRIIAAVVGPLMFGPWRKGAMTSAFAAAGKEIKEDNERFKGVYFTPMARISNPSKAALDERLARELWETTEAVLKELGA